MNSNEIYETWYNSLSYIDRELVDGVYVSPDPDYPFQPRKRLSTEAIVRAGVVEYDESGGIATLGWIPQPPTEYWTALSEELREREEEEKQREDEKEQIRQAAIEKYNAWMDENVKHLTRVYFYPRDIVPDRYSDYWFDKTRTIVFDFEDDFGWKKVLRRLDINGETYWLESSGSTGYMYVPYNQAAIWWQEKWDAIDYKPKAAWDILSSYLSGDRTYGSGYRQWLRDTFGISGLVELARNYVPYYEPNQLFDYGHVSRAYQLPVSDQNGELGYGEPGETYKELQRRLLNNQYAAELYRLKGWIPINLATSNDFWSEEEINAHRIKIQNRY